MTDITQDTIKAYIDTDYHVLGEAPFTLKVGVANEALTQLYKQTRSNCGVFITAWNPHGIKTDDTENKARQAELAKELSLRSLVFFDGIGKHPASDWEEPSFFVPGLSLEAAKALGRKYEQNAVVWCGIDTVPELVMLG